MEQNKTDTHKYLCDYTNDLRKMRDQWISEVTEKDERIFRLGERKKFWFRVSICEALVIAAGAYIVYATNK